jgi:hypothetical protein
MHKIESFCWWRTSTWLGIGLITPAKPAYEPNPMPEPVLDDLLGAILVCQAEPVASTPDLVTLVELLICLSYAHRSPAARS